MAHKVLFFMACKLKLIFSLALHMYKPIGLFDITSLECILVFQHNLVFSAKNECFGSYLRCCAMKKRAFLFISREVSKPVQLSGINSVQPL